jgi:hypothetical protein
MVVLTVKLWQMTGRARERDGVFRLLAGSPTYLKFY